MLCALSSHGCGPIARSSALRSRPAMMASICGTALTTWKVVGLTIVPANNYAAKTKEPCQSGGLHQLVHDIHTCTDG